ncbi:thiamine phosphate synthase [Humisphaera borealis]|uniref:Thiamine-phosphate synthase n=1 Tax=Humisphaera borealis TaxID=2807512 RepID=A0A7M2WYE9_9BACT|nr:thiamine phosphate synthase [Humisphaera borealis]QOV90449.1 thiamine phosphate synthase [Humisphaera borealis]
MNPEFPKLPPAEPSLQPGDGAASSGADSWADGSGRLPAGPILRLLDANANRAREALRVLEDYARFILDSESLSGRLKHVRHGLAEAVGPILPEAILHRDTPGDVGTTNKTAAELTRSSIEDVVVAAGKRLGEALRAIEEYLKTLDPSAAQKVETLRYASYDLEQRIARTLRPPACDFGSIELYVLVTESVCKGNWLDAATDALMGGADCLQLREKSLESGELLSRARQLVALCREFGVPCIINDRPDIAVLADADGVHVGQGDLPAVEARKIVGPNRIVGVSTHNIEQARQAVLDGADYIGVGPFFRSSTKPRDFIAGPEYARKVAETIGIPAVAIAGITEENVSEVLATGIRAVAVSSAVLGVDDVRVAAARLKEKVRSDESVSPVGQTFLSADSRARAFLPGPVPSMSALEKRRRRLPHWTLAGSAYFITFRVDSGELSEAERTIVLTHIREGHEKFYFLIGTVVMPDHVHAVLEPIGGVTLPRITKGMKGVSARKVNLIRGGSGSVWQDESWDRILRDQDELDEKLKYMLDNPVRKGLAEDGWSYPWWLFMGKR